MRARHYIYKAEKIYVWWIRRYIYFHNNKHPNEMGAAEIPAYLTHLTVEKSAAASTRNQALFALLFLYRKIPKIDLPRHKEFSPAQKSEEFRLF